MEGGGTRRTMGCKGRAGRSGVGCMGISGDLEGVREI